MKIRSRFSERVPVGLDCSGDKGRTRQDMKDECDINRILKGFGVSGTVSHVMRSPGEYSFASALTFHESMEIIRKADEMFMELPGKLRARFENRPENFLRFVQDPANADELIKMGLRERPKADPAPAPAPAPPPPA